MKSTLQLFCVFFLFLLWHAVHCCRGFHVGDPNERKWAPNKLFDDSSQKHWNECRSCACGRYFCPPPPPCVYIHYTAQCGRIGPSIIDMTTALSFCLDAYVAKPMHYFVCCSSQLTGAAGRGNMMVQLVQRDWRVRLDQKWSRSARSAYLACTPASEEWSDLDPPHVCLRSFRSSFSLKKSSVRPELLCILRLWCVPFHTSSRWRMSLCRTDRSKLTEPPPLCSLRSFRLGAAALLNHDTLVRLPWAICSRLPVICVDVWQACSRTRVC